MKTSNYGPEHPADIIRLRVAAGISTAPNPAAVVQQFVNGDVIAFIAGDVVVVTSTGILATTTAQDTRPIGIVLDDIAVGDTGPVQTAGYTPYIHVTASVSADAYGETSTTATEATANATLGTGSFCIFLSSGTTPDGLLFGATEGTGTVIPPGTYLTTTEGEQHAIVTVPASGAAATIDCSLANIFDITLTANCTLTITNSPAAGVGGVITVILRQGGSGSYTVTWPAPVVWQNPSNGLTGGSAPTLFTAVGAQNDVELATLDGGVTWGGTALSGSTSFGTPAFTFGTSNSAGAATAAIRTDASIAVFDTSNPTTLSYSEAPAPGSAGVAARRDHIHGMPASGTGIGEILIADVHSTPLIFADLLQNEAQTDLIYADP